MRSHPVRYRVRLAVVLTALLGAIEVLAQDAYPSKPIRFLVPIGSGSGPDTAARRIAPRLSERLGQQTGKLRALATSAAARSQAAPDLPTFSEAGLPDYEMSGWLAILAPANTPSAVVTKLSMAVNAAVAAPELREWSALTGSIFIASSPERLESHISAEIAKWSRVIKDANIRLE